MGCQSGTASQRMQGLSRLALLKPAHHARSSGFCACEPSSAPCL